MDHNKKIALIVLLCIAVLGIGGGLLFSALSEDKKPTDSPSATATPVPTLAGEADPDAGAATPTIPPQDYTDEEFVFTDDMTDVMFSHNAFFYNDDIAVRIYSRYDAKIYYTLDGSTPTEKSLVYDSSRGINLLANKGSTPKIYNVKALAVYADGSDSGVYSHGYFLGAKVTSRYETLIFNITGNPNDLVKGPDGIFYGTNYQLRGRTSERPVYLEVLSSDGTLMSSQPLGVRIYGGASRESSQKSMKFFARKSYGSETGSFYLNCFDCPALDGTQIVRFDKFVLRNSGNDFRFAFIRDELNQTLAVDAGFVDFQSVVPVIAYVNGNYFGFYWLHTNYCDEFFKDRYGKTPAEQAAEDGESFVEGEFVVLEGGDTFKKEDEDDEWNASIAEEYQETYWDFVDRDVTNDDVYEELTEWMDVENYLSYMAYNIYLCNKDWPHNNYKCYRYFPAEGESFGKASYDGRWRYLLHDIDYTYGMYEQHEVMASYDTLKQILNERSDRYSPMLAQLLQRDDCREYFVKKSLDFGNGALSEENVCATLDVLHASRESEMSTYYNYLISLRNEDVSWIDESQLPGRLQEIRDFAKARPARSVAYLRSQLGLGSTYTLTVSAVENARFLINSYRTEEGKAFQGTYFEDYATTITAEFAIGTAFDYWEVNGERVTTETLTLTADQVANDTITVVLHTKANAPNTVDIYAISANGSDYITLINRTGAEQNLTGFTLTDGTYDFFFEEGTILAAGEKLTVYCNNYVGELPEGTPTCIYNLSEGETVTLKQNDGTTLDAVTLPNLHSGFEFVKDRFDGHFYEIRVTE